MTDYRQPGGPRQTYFDALYRMNLKHKVMPGLVYLYLPAIAHAKGWNKETSLWFAFLNGMTQNPLTSLRLFERMSEPPRFREEMGRFQDWFDTEWPRLQFDTDRRYAKKETPLAIWSYMKLLHSEHVDDNVKERQSYLYDADGGEWENLWLMVTDNLHSFGRLSAWSYLEYVRIYGGGIDPDDLLFADSGSRSHRNGMLFLMDQDRFVDDKRIGHVVDYGGNFKRMCAWLSDEALGYMSRFMDLPGAGYFTFESQLCTFKNSFFGRRYPGVYADMAWERLNWYETNIGRDDNWRLINDIYRTLPDWLQVGNVRLTVAQRGAIFPTTGVPYRAEHFL